MTQLSWKIVGFVLLFVAVWWLVLLTLRGDDHYRPYDDVVAIRMAGKTPIQSQAQIDAQFEADTQAAIEASKHVKWWDDYDPAIHGEGSGTVRE